jgi:undecaprenyl-diphosphatase
VRTWLAVAAGALLISLPGGVSAAGGPFGIDHRIAFDDGSLWKHSNQTALIGLMIIGELGGALWEGGDSRLGKTLWQSIDATVIGSASSEVMKHAFGRTRPSQTDDPNQWFQGKSHYSFPSGEVTVVTSIITPLVLEYGRENPAVYALEAIPLYVGAARLKLQAHWQTDVLAGFALGTAAGWYSHSRDSPLVLSAMPRGAFVGFKHSW